MMKKILIGLGIIILGVVGWYFLSKQKTESGDIYGKTVDVSKEYLRLRYETDLVLTEAKKYSYEEWNKKVDEITKDWENLEKDATSLKKEAEKISNQKTSWKLSKEILAYDKKEISNIFDKAPAGKKIATLAKHLGVDAKMAFKILKQDQAQVEADAWNEAGDTFQKLETSAVVIKDGCKVAGFVGGIVITGGTSAVATGSMLTKAAIIVGGADLTLEVTDDAATIALGNHNKVSAIVASARTVTEPLASILTISDIPNNLKTGFEKFSAVMVTIDQFNSATQDGKVVGIKLPVYSPKKNEEKIEVVTMTSDEINKWMEENNIENKPETVDEIKNILEIVNEIKTSETKITEERPEDEKTDSNLVTGVWEGIIRWTSGANKPEEEKTVTFEFLDGGKINKITTDLEFNTWEQSGDIVRIYEAEKDDGYHEFKKEGDKLTFIKIAGPDQEDSSKWAEVYAGEDFFGGKFFTLILVKQK